MWFLLLWLIPLCAAAQIRVDAESFGASEKEIRAILNAVVETFPEQKLPPLFVRRSPRGPITFFEKNLQGETVIHLSAQGTYWSQYIYQFAHELMHVRTGFHPGDRKNKWFDEVLCEAASLFALRKLSIQWREHPPYPSWRKYRHRLHEYSLKVIHSREKLPLEEVGAFYQKHQRQLRHSPKERALNGAIANALLRLFEEAPERWLALESLNHNPPQNDISLAKRLSNWRDSASLEHRPFISALNTIFHP